MKRRYCEHRICVPSGTQIRSSGIIPETLESQNCSVVPSEKFFQKSEIFHFFQNISFRGNRRVAVKIHRELNRRMPQNLTDNFHGHIVFNRSCCKSVADSVEFIMRNTGCFENPFIYIAKVAWLNRTPDFVGKHIAIIFVTSSGTQLFKCLS